MDKIYSFVSAWAEMMLFVKSGHGKTHVRFHKRSVTLCGRLLKGETVSPEALESQLCSKCLHYCMSRHSEHFSYREVVANAK